MTALKEALKEVMEATGPLVGVKPSTLSNKRTGKLLGIRSITAPSIKVYLVETVRHGLVQR